MFTSIGNTLYFHDPLPTEKQLLSGLAISVVTAGILNGVTDPNYNFIGTRVTPPTVEPLPIPTVGVTVDDVGVASNVGDDISSNVSNSISTEVSSTNEPLPMQGKVMHTIKGPDGKVTYVFTNPDGGTNSVYRGIDKITEEVKYIGITERNPDVRFLEHLNSGTEKSLLRFESIDGLNNLNRIDARIIEQTLQNGYGMDNLLNIRNSISPAYWENYQIPKSW